MTVERITIMPDGPSPVESTSKSATPAAAPARSPEVARPASVEEIFRTTRPIAQIHERIEPSLENSRSLLVHHRPEEDEVIVNASLSPEERLKEAGQLLKTKLTPEQEAAVLKAHNEAADELGKDEGPVGVYNYKEGQLKRKAEILKEAGFNKEQRRELMESGLTGVSLDATKADEFNLKDFEGDDFVHGIAEDALAGINAGVADQDFLKNLIQELRSNKGADKDLTRKLWLKLEGYRKKTDDLDRTPPVDTKPEAVESKKIGSGFQELIDDYESDEVKLFEIRSNRGLHELVKERNRYLELKAFEDHGVPLTADEQKEYENLKPIVEEYDALHDQVIEKRNKIEKMIDVVMQPGSMLTPEIEKLRKLFRAAVFKSKGKVSRYGQSQGDSSEIVRELQQYNESLLKGQLPRELAHQYGKEYAGIAEYILRNVGASMNKYLQGTFHPEATIFLNTGDRLFLTLFNEIKQDRKKERLRAGPEDRLQFNDWREKYDFTWAEDVDELRDTINDWLDKFKAHFSAGPGETPLSPQQLDQDVNRYRANAISSLEVAFHNIGISEDDPRARELRNTIDSTVDVVAGVIFAEIPEGFDVYLGHLTEFSYAFDKRHDAIYLGNPKSALIFDFLSEDHEIDREMVNINMGYPGSVEKPEKGVIERYRSVIEERAKHYAMTHEYYISDKDFEEAVLDREGVEKQVNKEIENGELVIEGMDAVDNIVEARLESRRNRIENGRYTWGEDDPIERLLLSGGLDRISRTVNSDPQLEAKRLEAIRKARIRGKAFRDIKIRLDKAEGLRLNPEERKLQVRQRIKAQIIEIQGGGKEDTQGFGAAYIARFIERDAKGKLRRPEDQDAALWRWVNQENNRLIADGKDIWAPTEWDYVRLSINRPTDLIDRALTKEHFKAMIEEIKDPLLIPFLGLKSTQEVEIRQTIYDMVNRGEITEDRAGEIFEDVRTAKARAEAQARRAFDISWPYLKFLGQEAMDGGMVARTVDKEGKTKLISVWREVQDILKSKIDKEEKDVEDEVKVYEVFANKIRGFSDPDFTGFRNKELADKRKAVETAYRTRLNIPTTKILTVPQQEKVDEEVSRYETHIDTIRAMDDEALEQGKVEQRRWLRRDKTFGATLALRELGIAHDLPIWHYPMFNEPGMVGHVAKYMGYTDRDKPIIADVIDKGRREMKAVWGYVADKYMDGQILIVDDNPRIGQHQENPERARVVNLSGNMRLREIFESMFMISTSGGVELADWITKFGDLGIYSLMTEMGQKNMQEFHGFKARRDKSERRRQPIWNASESRDPITYAKRLTESSGVKPFLTGGKTKQGYEPGILNEPFQGMYKLRDKFFDVLGGHTWEPKGKLLALLKDRQVRDHDFVNKMQAILMEEGANSFLDPVAKDQLTEIGAGIMKPLIDLLDSLRYQMNRGGRTPTNWKLFSQQIIDAYIEKMLVRETQAGYDEAGNLVRPAKQERLGDAHLAYAKQGRSPTGAEVFRAILKGSSYHALSNMEIEDLKLEPQFRKAQNDLNTARTQAILNVLPSVPTTELTGKIDEVISSFGEGFHPPADVEAKVLEAVQPNIEAAIAAGKIVPAELQDLLNKRRVYLKSQQTSEFETKRDLVRMVRHHITDYVHKNVVGEWAANFAATIKGYHKDQPSH